MAFLSAGDEAAFFSWVGGIESVGVVGDGDAIRVQVPRSLPDASLRELLALFWRYDIDMAQLAQFASASNAVWFAEPNSYWHERVFR